MRIVALSLLSFALLACVGNDRASDGSTSGRAASGFEACRGPFFNGTGVGVLRVGASIDSVHHDCHVIADTTELGDEGIPERIALVALATDTVEVAVDSGRVSRISIRTPGLLTPDSIRVGTPLVRLLALPRIHGTSAENALYVLSPERCGLSFRVTDPAADAPPPEWTAAMLGKLPPNTAVTAILITGTALSSNQRCR